MNSLSEKVKHLRKAKGLTLEGLADLIDAGKSYVWELENRGVERPSGERLNRIAAALGVTPEFLLNDKLAEPDANELDQAFFRLYQSISDPKTKERIRTILKTLTDED
jgi:transcriptional regulator with XRE-family HTH domain